MFWLIFVIAMWGVIHSLLASMGFKNFLSRVLGNKFMKSYRLLYNIFAVISSAPVLYLMVSLPDTPLYQVPAPWSYLQLAGQGISVILLLGAVWQTDILSFVGLRQLIDRTPAKGMRGYSASLVEDEKTGDLVINGFYRYVRHPLYTFSLLILWLSPSMTINSFVVYMALTIYVLLGIVFEERKLLREFGQEYANYKSVTPMLIPGLPRTGTQRHTPAGKVDGNK